MPSSPWWTCSARLACCRAQGADLGVGQLPTRERFCQGRQRSEGARHADPFPGGPKVKPHPPGEPSSAGAEAAVPPATGVEVADEVEEAGGGGLEMRRQLGDRVPQSVQLRVGIRCCVDGGRVDLHGEPPLCWGDSTPGFRSHPGEPRTGDSGASDDFRSPPALPSMAGLMWAAGPAAVESGRHAATPPGRGRQAKNAGRFTPGESPRPTAASPAGAA